MQAVVDAATMFADHHQQHLDALNAVITGAGATAVTEPNAAVFDALIKPAVDAAAAESDPLKAEAAAVTLAITLEEAATQTYCFAAGALSDPALRSTIMTIGGVEARHAAMLRLAGFGQAPDEVFVGGRSFFPGTNPLAGIDGTLRSPADLGVRILPRDGTRRRGRTPRRRRAPAPGHGAGAVRRASPASLPSVTGTGSVIEWLLNSDPSIRWQVMRDLLDAPEREWMTERAKVETEGWGARLLSCQDEDGQWAGGAFLPAGFDPREWKQRGQPWTATTFSLSQLREFGLDPACDCARRAVKLIGANARWEEGGQPYWEGEVEECINGRTVADGAYFGDRRLAHRRQAGRRASRRRWLELRADQWLRPLVFRQHHQCAGRFAGIPEIDRRHASVSRGAQDG